MTSTQSRTRLGWLTLLLMVLLLAFGSARTAVAELLIQYALTSEQLEAATLASRLNPDNAEAQYVRGLVADSQGDLPAAVDAFQQAVNLRPDDYLLWLSLARVTELNGNAAKAIDAANRAMQLAPYYAQTHWQLGNMLVRAGRRDEGFKELQYASTRDRGLRSAAIDLAWQISGGDAQFVLSKLPPADGQSAMALADYLRRRGAVSEATAILVANRDPDTSAARARFLSELISTGKFREAHQLWLSAHPEAANGSGELINNPGFDQETNLDEPGFGWRSVNRPSTIGLTLDSEGATQPPALRIDFKGDPGADFMVISQLVKVMPQTQYQLRFSARAKDMVSGGMPFVMVLDPNGNNILGKSNALTGDKWAELTIDFKTLEKTEVVEIRLRREICYTLPCPLFGQVWLDNFSLKKAKG